MWTALITAALIAGTTPQAAAPIIPAPQTTQALADSGIEGSGANTRASDPPREVICQRRPVTGSLLNHRRCRTRSQAQTARNQAQDFMDRAQTVVAPPEAAILTPTPQ